MNHIVSFSGGKDSTAVLLQTLEARDSGGSEFSVIHCATGWEHPYTEQYVLEMQDRCRGWGVGLTILQGEHGDFADLCIGKGIFPSRRRRFCTEKLKIEPSNMYLAALDAEVTLYLGIRAEESNARAAAPMREWVDMTGWRKWSSSVPGYWLERPILLWSVGEVFEIHQRHNIEPNPLYKSGCGRVGCYPCIQVTQRELLALVRRFPDIEQRVVDLEEAVSAKRKGGIYHTFWRVGYIPERFGSLPHTTRDGRNIKIATARDVFRYIKAKDADQLPLLPPASCVSIYAGLCE